ncbi:glycoside hydrolase deacetylase [Lecanosticta acicola]|uniref:Glycoside hydrolase deacetylase n=1 Tax=Lecanosticta acicola TaxID=111012 RepID=A0AAI9E7D4_9PEZI|nr:glycoside hydrolase deacetylase [Lecanosticta acicola]
MYSSAGIILCSLFALSSAHPGGVGILGAPPSLLQGLKLRDHDHHGEAQPALSLRDTPNCGTQANNASCPTGQCCSQDGFCGTGRAFCDAPQCQFRFGPACDANILPQGTNTSSVPRPQLGSVPYSPQQIWNCTEDKTVALTYDDGPYLYSLDLYKILAKYNAKATFFVTGVNIGKHAIDNTSTPWPQLLKYAYDSGHQIGQHTWSHPDLDKITQAERYTEITKLEMALRNILGFFPTYFRPPYEDCHTSSGCMSDMQALGYHTIMQNVWTDDYVNYTPELYDQLVSNFTEGISGANASNNHIIYAHEQEKPTVYNLTDYMIQTLSKDGYRFVTVGECLGDPAENWYRDASTGGPVPVKIFGVGAPKAPLTLNAASSSSSSSQGASSSGTSAAVQKSAAPRFAVFAPTAATAWALCAMIAALNLLLL